MMKTVSVLSFVLFLTSYISIAQEYSDLWGLNGEKWVPGSPLEDFSNAGYHEGNDPFPRWPVKVNVKDFGAVGDGEADDTRAFRDAIEACPANGAVYIPAGTYKITDWLRYDGKSNVIIRGEDMYETILTFPTGLEELHSAPTQTGGGYPTTSYSWTGGFLWFENAEEVGIENLTFKFPDLPYAGHWNEPGYNMVEFTRSTNCWMRNIYGYNMDSGPYAIRSSNITFNNIVLDAYPDRLRQVAYHHGITSKASTYCLMENCEFRKPSFHCMSMEYGSQWNVWSRCKGENTEIDHHQNRDDITHNLFTDIDMGIGSGLGSHRNFENTFNETYWNMRSSEPVTTVGLPGADKNTLIVGFNLGIDVPDIQDPGLPWYEMIGTHDVYPPNIHIAQLKKRLDVDNLPPEVMITRPLNNIEFPLGATVTVTAMSDDRDGSLEQVELLINGNSYGMLEEQPFQWTFPEMNHGNYQFTAMARDDLGAVSMDTVSIVVGDPSGVINSGSKLIKPGIVPGRNSVMVYFYQEQSGDADVFLYSLSGTLVAANTMVTGKGANHFTWKGLPVLEKGKYILLINTAQSRQVIPFIY
jgi:hypothetical protein